MKLKKILCALLAALTIMPAVISCGDSSTGSPDVTTAPGDQTPDSTTGETTSAELGTPLPDSNFEGYDFRIAHNESTSETAAWNIADVDANEVNGDLINDAVYTRNMRVEEAYNCTVSALPIPSANLMTTVSNSVLAGDNALDAVTRDIETMCANVLKGLFTDLSKNPYLDFTGSWWATSIMEGISVGGKTYLATGDICLNDDKATWSVLFNKKLAENYALPDMYQLVRDGDWTLDALYGYASGASADLNGDDKLTLEDDQWGLYDQLESVVAFYIAAGQPAMTAEANGTVTYNLDSDQSVTTFGKIYDFMADQSFQWIADNYTIDDKWNTLRRYWRADGALFYNVTLSALTLIRDMETDFGLLPVPKIYEDQEEYYSTFQYGNATAYAVPMTNPDMDRAGIILEALARGSVDTLTPAYYDMTLEMKAVRDDESIEMMELIFASRIFDFSMGFGEIGTVTFLKNQIAAKSNGFSSAEASNHDKMLTAVNKVLATVADLP